MIYFVSYVWARKDGHGSGYGNTQMQTDVEISTVDHVRAIECWIKRDIFGFADGTVTVLNFILLSKATP